jgi:hypothetical protein
VTEKEKKAAYAKVWYAQNRVRVLKKVAAQRRADPKKFHVREHAWDAANRDKRNKWASVRGKQQRAEFRALHPLPIRCKHDCFSTVTPESAYWVGFIMADGCIHKANVRISLAERDGDHLKKFCQLAEINREPVRNGKNRRSK